ncbi:hypothetical protein B0H15DRAFT_34009 [Mycena belliarum]|uniref:Uncharacterized protein n=1 Tax=Mycena belliarum TaxID=1033014 RepID=A0AAD6UDB0_9AGAR|nr:hypothetical protein B0H15DRAFT_34009 [Mycena belliae]
MSRRVPAQPRRDSCARLYLATARRAAAMWPAHRGPSRGSARMGLGLAGSGIATSYHLLLPPGPGYVRISEHRSAERISTRLDQTIIRITRRARTCLSTSSEDRFAWIPLSPSMRRASLVWAWTAVFWGGWSGSTTTGCYAGGGGTGQVTVLGVGLIWPGQLVGPETCQHVRRRDA